MLRFPIHGFASRVDDTVARAMAILRAREAGVAARPVAGAASREPTLEMKRE
jgi:hypothetical protein